MEHDYFDIREDDSIIEIIKRGENLAISFFLSSSARETEKSWIDGSITGVGEGNHASKYHLSLMAADRSMSTSSPLMAKLTSRTRLKRYTRS